MNTDALLNIPGQKQDKRRLLNVIYQYITYRTLFLHPKTNVIVTQVTSVTLNVTSYGKHR